MSAEADQRVAASLGLHPEAVGIARGQFNDEAAGVIIRAIMADRIRQVLDEDARRLRNITAGGLDHLQGHMDGLELAIGTITTRLD